jgi:hypothetical protein
VSKDSPAGHLHQFCTGNPSVVPGIAQCTQNAQCKMWSCCREMSMANPTKNHGTGQLGRRRVVEAGTALKIVGMLLVSS